VSTCINGERFGTTYPELFDAILLDAPCSGEGTSFKSDASLDMRKPQRIKAIASLQYQLIISAYKALKPGGVMIYSTCTLNPYENEITIRRLIEYVKGEIELIPIQRSNLDHGIGEYLGTEILTTQQSQACLRARPHRHQTGGFFIAAMRKPINYRHEYDKIRQIQPKQIAQRINQEQQIDTDSRLTQYR
jgi:16S rRNA (cytosine1407-C5)-methyltransferase